jgi:DNA polymerase-3 subunit gamma/tau
MSYLVLARKWRPQNFQEVIGQEHVVRTLANAIKTNHVVHAYLFCGPRGTGKTTAARILAKALNCERGPTAEPCGQCPPCQQIAAGNSIDVAEIDGASNNGVENVREIRENAKYLPQSDRHKIYIIDEVHMLSGAAFNALLKTLEEPPGHVKFILATTEPQKLPDTILSRCQRHNFKRIPAGRILERLQQICQAEGATLSSTSLALIVRQSDGSMRDALSVLDHLFSACGKSPSNEAVAEALGAIDQTLVHQFTEDLVRRDAKGLLQRCEQVFNRGVDLKKLGEEIAFQLRHLFVAKATGEAPAELAEAEQQALLALAPEADLAQLARLFDVVHTAVSDLPKAAQPRIAFEMALLKAVQLAPAASIPELLERVERLGVSATGPENTSKLGAPGGRSEVKSFRA